MMGSTASGCVRHFRVHPAEGVHRADPAILHEVDEQVLGVRWLRLSKGAQEAELRMARLMVLEAIMARAPEALTTADVSTPDDVVESFAERDDFDLTRDGTLVVRWTGGGPVIAALTDHEAAAIARRMAAVAAERDSAENTRTESAVALVGIGWAVRAAIIVFGLAVWMLTDAFPLAGRIVSVVAIVILAGIATWPINDWAVKRYRSTGSAND